MFKGDLRKKKPPMLAQSHQQTVTPYLDGFTCDGGRRREKRKLDLKSGEFIGTERWESRVPQRGACRTAYDCLAQPFLRFHHTDTAAQTSVHMQGHKNAAMLSKYTLVWDWFGKFTVPHRI